MLASKASQGCSKSGCVFLLVLGVLVTILGTVAVWYLGYIELPKFVTGPLKKLGIKRRDPNKPLFAPAKEPSKDSSEERVCGMRKDFATLAAKLGLVGGAAIVGGYVTRKKWLPNVSDRYKKKL